MSGIVALEKIRSADQSAQLPLLLDGAQRPHLLYFFCGWRQPLFALTLRKASPSILPEKLVAHPPAIGFQHPTRIIRIGSSFVKEVG